MCTVTLYYIPTGIFEKKLKTNEAPFIINKFYEQVLGEVQIYGFGHEKINMSRLVHYSKDI